MSVEEIRAQRRDLEDDEENAEEEEAHTQEVLMNEDGSIQVESSATVTDGSDYAETDNDATEPSTSSVASGTDDEDSVHVQDSEKKKTLVDMASCPPVGSLADLTISPPGSPAPSSPVITMDHTRMKSPAPSTSSASGSHRPPTHSRSNEAYLQTVL